MPTSEPNINELISRYVDGQMTIEELEQFLEAVRGGSADNALSNAILNDLEEGRYTQLLSDEKFRQLYEQLREKTAPVRVHRIHFLRTAWFRYAAAILLIITGIAVYYTVFHTPQSGNRVVQNVPPPVPNDVSPGFNRAVLTLSDGSKIELDSAASETIKDGTLSIENINGQLKYSASGTLSPAGGGPREAGEGGPSATNTMTTPKGGQYQLTLSDGTKVWLNAASSITYPTSFNGNTRQVSITGEAYFEVKSNKEKPFIVKTKSDQITVLGTSFNVNAYEDENAMKTSLLEGSVRVGDKLLKPGQAFLNGKIIATNVAQDVAWKNGVFSFTDADIKGVMRQLARWYDVEISYRGKIPQGEFSGKIGRNLSLSKVLSVLSTYGFSYKIEGRKVIIGE